MGTFLVSFVFMALVMAGMAVGVMMGRGPLKGSCGGMGALGIDTACDICGGNPQLCDEETRDVVTKDVGRKEQASLYYPADK
ncbi:MAG: hypothetical protein ACJAZ0_001007 [Halioglobus sp.]|jgi:hypothetical protein